ncbi:light-harvesting protein [Phaeovibrio sulfidiphilus]|nr:light-harvesting protein [Phaeovibrio sulfidiphilus]
MADNTKVYPSGLTEKEAMEFGEWYMRGFAGFLLGAVCFHVVVFSYVPWF